MNTHALFHKTYRKRGILTLHWPNVPLRSKPTGAGNHYVNFKFRCNTMNLKLQHSKADIEPVLGFLLQSLLTDRSSSIRKFSRNSVK
jgi:hypothetical protein